MPTAFTNLALKQTFATIYARAGGTQIKREAKDGYFKETVVTFLHISLSPSLIVIISKWWVDRFLKEDLQNQGKFQHKNQLIETRICKVSKPDLIYIHFLISNPMASTEVVVVVEIL